jgi:lipopolysaccharide transport system permease protein
MGQTPNAVSASIVDRSLRLEAADDTMRFELRDRENEALLGGDARKIAEGWAIELPEDDGNYVVLGFRPSGSGLLAFDVDVTGGSPVLIRSTATSPSARRLRLWARTMRRALFYPVVSIWARRSLIRSMVRRDIAGRYAGSHAGVFWTVIHPLLMMLTYAFVFGLVLRTRFAGDDRPSSFVLYFLAGMLPWLPFSEAAGRASVVIVEHANFVKKLVFPLEILPVNLTFAGLFSQFFAVLIFFAALLMFGRDIPPTAFYLPLLLVPQVLFTLGLSWVLAALGVLVRDLGQLIGFLITVWFFLTPICYDEAMLPQAYHGLFALNPFYVLVRAYRAVLLENAAPDWNAFLWLTLVSAGLFWAGYAWFHRMRRQFADLV